MATTLIAERIDSPTEFVDELLPGTKLLHGQYRVQSFLNSGGFGIIYLATDSLDRKVVIKECFADSLCRRVGTKVGVRTRAHQDAFGAVVNLFIREAKSLSRLAHPNIVGVHQVFEDNETAYMAMDYIEGPDLLTLIEDDTVSFTPAEIVALLKKVLGAVAFIHKKGVLHRDISPENILIRNDGEPILIDFGAARDQASGTGRTLSAIRVVKDGYSPHEFYLAGGAQIESSDLYALAASFYHLIFGSPPPDSKYRLAAIAKGRTDPCVRLAGKIGGYPEGFLAALDKALQVMPDDRIPTADLWLEMIETRARIPAPTDNTVVAFREHFRVPPATPAPTLRDTGRAVPVPDTSDTVNRLISEVIRNAANLAGTTDRQKAAEESSPAAQNRKAPAEARKVETQVTNAQAEDLVAESEDDGQTPDIATAEPVPAGIPARAPRGSLQIGPVALLSTFAVLSAFATLAVM